MAEVFEIKILTKKQISFELINLCVQDANFVLKSIETIDDWSFSNKQMIKISDTDIIDDLIEKNIIILEGDILGNNCGANIAKEDDNYSYEFWISTNNIRFLAEESVTSNNTRIYEAIVKAIVTNVNAADFLYGAIGVETYIEDGNDINSIVRNSSNVLLWVLPQNVNLSNESFNVEIVNSFKIYSIID